MIKDEKLAAASMKSKDTVLWGKYDNHYDWEWSYGRPYLTPYTLNIGHQVLLRDWTVAKKLHDLGVKSVLDIGSDTGHFLAVLKHFGIEAVGIDASKEACDFVESKRQNMCYNIGIQSLITLDIDTYDCITCMNITHAHWKDSDFNEELKKKLIAWIRDHSKYTVLSDFTHQDRSWEGLTKVHDFNILPFYFSKTVYKVAKLLHIDTLINYVSLQKCYKTNTSHKKLN